MRLAQSISWKRGEFRALGQVHAMRDAKTTLCNIAVGSWWELRSCADIDAPSRVSCLRCQAILNSASAEHRPLE